MDMPIDMQHQQMGYDRAATMFSPEGLLLQVDYAEKAVRLGSASVAMKCKDGVFILADKRTEDNLIVKESASKIYEIDSHIISSVSGIVSDARVLIEKAQILAQQNRLTYDSAIEPELIIKEISSIKQQFTQYGGARPFGVAVMIAGILDGEGRVYSSDVTGNYFEYYANAIGENDSKIKELLREKYKKDLTIKQGLKTVLDIFKEIKGDKFNLDFFEFSFISEKEEKIQKIEGKKISEFLK